MSVRRRLALAAGAFALLVVSVIGTANAVVLVRSHDRVETDAHDLGHAQAAIVPGSMVRPDGTLGAVVQARVDGAVALYEAGTVDKILLSGDHGTPEYNEPDTMRDAVLAAGVPPEDVFTDYAGFNTWHTMRRARVVFEVDSAVVVTQGFHAPRAVDLGRAAGLDVHALAVDGGSLRVSARELLARVRGLGEAIIRPDVTLGPVLPVSGDGRTSWAEPVTAPAPRE